MESGISAGELIESVRATERAQWIAPAGLRELQGRRLRALVSFAFERVPFYRERFLAAGIRPDQVRMPADLALLPLLTRRDLEQAGQNGLQPGGVPLVAARTSGTSGRFLTVHQSPDYGVRTVFPLWRRALRAGGMMPNERYLRITHADRREYPTLLRTRDCSVSAPVSELMGCLAVQRPHALLLHPSMLQFLCLEYPRRGRKPPGDLRRLFTLGDTLTASTRRQAEQVFGCAPIDQYAAIEVPGGIAWQCERREGYHVNADHLLLELLDEHGLPVAPSAAGVPGQVVITDLSVRAVPLIRYRLMDSAVWSDRLCACGRGLPCLERISGRIMERMRLPDGEWLTIHQLDDALAPVSEVLQYQAQQVEPDRVVVRIVLAENCDHRVALDRIERGLRRTSLRGVRLELDPVDRIEVDANREYRVLVPQAGAVPES